MGIQLYPSQPLNSVTTSPALPFSWHSGPRAQHSSAQELPGCFVSQMISAWHSIFSHEIINQVIKEQLILDGLF